MAGGPKVECATMRKPDPVRVSNADLRRPVAHGGRALTSTGDTAHAAAVSLLLPQTRTGTVQSVRQVDIHGDRYLDLAVTLDDAEAPVVGRVGAMECPPDLAPGDRVSLRFTMGVITSVSRA